jgi:hypothetical protein
MHTQTSPTKPSLFVTANLAVAAYLVAGRHLQLVRVDATDSAPAEFIFTDPEHRGDELEAGFIADALVPAATFHRQLRTLRRLIEEKSQLARAHRSSKFNYQGYEHAYAHKR